MTDENAMPQETPPERENPQAKAGPNAFEYALERMLFLSRWLMAPIYLGLAATLLVLLWVFFVEFFHLIVSLESISPTDIILIVLSLIDLSLVGNLLLIVIFSGYENFVSRLDVTDEEDRPDWHGKVDFSAIKLKLLASIVAISAIQLLKAFMEVKKFSDNELFWMVAIHLTFIVSGVMMALMDWIKARTHSEKNI